MIPVCFPQELSLGYDDGSAHRFLAGGEVEVGKGLLPSDDRVYLLIDEFLQQVRGDCLRRGAALPRVLPQDIFARQGHWPPTVSELLAGKDLSPGRPLVICLFNGGGGGLGDGIMFAPALDVLARRLSARTGEAVRFVLYTMLPKRTGAVLQALPYVRVAPMQLSVAEFRRFDAYVDFSGMLLDEKFQNSHMTDFVLDRMGIVPESVAPEEKEPFVWLPEQRDVAVEAALGRARAASAKPLVAVVFRSSYTRTLPDAKAAELLRAMAARYQPVLIMDSAQSGAVFLREQGLEETVLDLSPVSTDFSRYMELLGGMDAIISVDTSAVHVGGALRKPTVGIFNSIRKELRIHYSTTVRGLQLSYRGRKCQAPCGLSKSRAYVRGSMADGRPFHLECGYACDEAVDQPAILDVAMARIKAMDPAGDVARQHEEIRQEMAAALHAGASPCWESLSVATVLASLVEVIAETREKGGDAVLSCPVCRVPVGQRRLGRWLGGDRYRCASCEALFDDVRQVKCGWGLPSSMAMVPGQAEQHFLRALLQDLLASGGRRVLVLSLANEVAWQRSWSGFASGCARLAPEVIVGHWNAGAEEAVDGEFDLIVAAGIMDNVQDPQGVVDALRRRLGLGGILAVVTPNRQNLDCLAGSANDYCETAGRMAWNAVTHARFWQAAGLRCLGLRATPLEWEIVRGVIGDLPPLTIQPPDRSDLVVRLQGRELAPMLGRYLAPLLQAMGEGNGRFLISFGQRNSFFHNE